MLWESHKVWFRVILWDSSERVYFTALLDMAAFDFTWNLLIGRLCWDYAYAVRQFYSKWNMAELLFFRGPIDYAKFNQFFGTIPAKRRLPETTALLSQNTVQK